jgi:ATP-binding cassette subfamily B protein
VPDRPRPWREAWRDRVAGARAVLALAVRADPVGVIGTAVLGLLQSGMAPLSALALKRITDGVSYDLGASIVTGVALFAIVQLWGNVSAAVNFPLRMRVMERAGHAVDQELMRLAGGAFGLEHFERPEYADKVELLRGARRQLGQVPDTLVWNTTSLLQLVLSAGVLASAHPALIALPLFALPAIAVSQRTVWRVETLQEELAERGRTRTHLFKVALSPAAGKELRVFGLADTMLRRYDDLWRSMETEIVRVQSRFLLKSVLAWLVFAVGYVGAIALVVRDAAAGRASPGEVMLAVTLAAQIRQQMQQVYGMVQWATQVMVSAERFGWLRSHAKGAAALSRPVDPAPVPERLTHGITLANLSFRYPGTGPESGVLTGVDIHLPAGSTVAVVGDNGAGKSTLVKLLARFYDPTDGAVLVDGVDLRRFDVDEWRQCLSAGFQDYARFELEAREVVGVGRLDGLEDEVAVQGALDRAAASTLVDELPSGLGTLVGRSFEGGVELSGGQWQKLALGRAMMRPHPLVLLLDEPTAALDAPTEHALFERYAGAARRAAGETGAITLLVSHRFSTVRMADLILVVDGQTISEAGTHTELMGRGGLYAELYELQARAYR